MRSVKIAKEKMVSLQNFLKTPIEYDVDEFKMQKQDASKLICAVRNYYRHQEALEDIERGLHPSETLPLSANQWQRRKIKQELNKYPF